MLGAPHEGSLAGDTVYVAAVDAKGNAASLIFSLGYATLAAKNRQAEKILIPVLDILQSVPILGFLSITVTG